MKDLLVTSRWTNSNQAHEVHQLGIDRKDIANLCIDVDGTVVWPLTTKLIKHAGKELDQIAYEAYLDACGPSCAIPWSHVAPSGKRVWYSVAGAVQHYTLEAQKPTAKKPTLDELAQNFKLYRAQCLDCGGDYQEAIEIALKRITDQLAPWLGPDFFGPPSSSTTPDPTPEPAPCGMSEHAPEAPASPPPPESARQSLADLLRTAKTACHETREAAVLGNLATCAKLLSVPELSEKLVRNRRLLDLQRLDDQTDEIVRELLVALDGLAQAKKEVDPKQ